MSKSNAVTPASFQYINHRFAQKGAFIQLSADQFEKIEGAYSMLEAVCGVARFIKNLLELENKKLIEYDNAFWKSTENDDGIYRIIFNLQYDIDQSREYLGEVDDRLINNEKARFDLGLSYDQLDLINSLIYRCGLDDSKKMTIRSLSFHRSIFQNIYSIADRLYKELTVLLEAAKQVPESEAAEAAS